MKIAIQPADLDRDREVLISTLRHYLTPTSNMSRFEWLYRQNPHGAPQVWLARDNETGEVVGASAAFRRRAIVNGCAKAGWVLGDFCVADKYRSLGPALQLQRATLAEVVKLPESDFCYDFPSEQLTAIYRRIGIQPAAQMVRLAKPLRLDEKLKRLGKLGAPLGWIGNVALRISDWRISGAKNLDITAHQGECGDEFSQLAEKVKAANAVEIQRSAGYLNWRYLRHPFFTHQVLTARTQGELQGYLVFTGGNGNAQITDWCVAGPGVLKALICALVSRLRKTGTVTVSAFLLDSDPRMALLKSMGFWPRESTPVMVNWTTPSNGSAAVHWRLMYGDRDS
ncbi:MAG TPA: hypothetical protein VFL42_05935 [Terriglobales bacterium]|nr:hypothetical protein [Terriglobales bacterium]